MDKKNKIIGFTQLRNELEKGNLENFTRCMDFCEKIYVYDQGSTDGSIEYYNNNSKFVVIRSEENRFWDEQKCKAQLLQKLLDEQPDTDWIFWMDGDTLLDGRLLRDNNSAMIELCASSEESDVGVVLFGHLNLWRSDTYYRIDNKFHGLNAGVSALWKNTGKLNFPLGPGLHQSPVPAGVNSNYKKCKYTLIHRGFATESQILNRYLERYKLYRSHGQGGWILNRLFDESTLNTCRADDGILPDWFNMTDDIKPETKTRLIDIYREEVESNIGMTWGEAMNNHRRRWLL